MLGTHTVGEREEDYDTAVVVCVCHISLDTALGVRLAQRILSFKVQSAAELLMTDIARLMLGSTLCRSHIAEGVASTNLHPLVLSRLTDTSHGKEPAQ